MDGELRRMRGRKRRRLERSLTLLRLFVLASAAILVAAAVGISWLLAHTLDAQALTAERQALVTYVDGVVRPTLVRDGRVVVTQSNTAHLLTALRTQPDVVSIKVWRADGVLAWTNRDRVRIGRRFPLDGFLGTALRTDRPIAALVGTGADGEDSFERNRLGLSHLFEVYAPIDGTRGGAIGAYEIYANPRALDALIGSRRTTLWLAVAGVFLVLWVTLVLLVRGASQMLRRQNATLRARTALLAQSNTLLEASALETVETLNATVDAKDPYTAGHSQRVRRIAVALGEELGLAPARLEMLGFAGLFHDIGKLGVPDAILLKPDRLTDEEFERIKRHPDDGARIVGRLRRLQDAVPFIRHHHERWDGRGYPDGLAADAIPLEAAIVGLADALDAMTTDRPYSPARPLRAAADELVRNRGTQFAPDVVDAFVRVLARDPGILAGDAPLADAVAV